jgi:AraC-like DNA-binding protein
MNRLYILENKVFYLGKLPDISEHRLGAVALCVGVDKSFRVLESESHLWQECQSVLIPPGCMHEIELGNTIMGILFLEPESEDYNTLRNLMSGGDWQCLYHLRHEKEVVDLLSDLYQHPRDAGTTRQILDRILEPDPTARNVHHSIDTRIDRVIRLIKEDVSQSYSVEALAGSINLSPTRLVHLFKEQTGVPIRRFRQWNRMKAVASFIAAGDTLTTAALNAGFSDSAHFSRAFRNMFGIKPSLLFNRSADLEIVIG